MSDRDRKSPFRRGGGKPFEKGRKSAGRPAWRDRGGGSDGPVILYCWPTGVAAPAQPPRADPQPPLPGKAPPPPAPQKLATPWPPESVPAPALHPGHQHT